MEVAIGHLEGKELKMLKGIDISNWQAGLVPHTLDIDFCIAKATEGNWFVDNACDGFIQDCIGHGILWGFYHFAGNADPVLEADWFVDNTANYFKHGIPVLDYEVDNGNDVYWVERFMQRVYDRTGVWCMLYTAASWLPRFQGSWITGKCGLWLAGYPYPAQTWRYDDPPYGCYPWEFIAIWQFTSSLQIGWNSGLDGDIAYMDAAAWAKYAQCSDASAHDLPPVQPVKDYNAVVNQVLDGLWGTGQDRYNRLTAAGYDADYVQALINDLYDVANQVIAGEWGNGETRHYNLNVAGYNYEQVQRIVNAIMDAH